MKIFSQIENEIDSYLTGTVTISEGYKFSQYRLIKRLVIYANQIFPKGKVDKQGNYKYWIDVIQPRIDSEVKNIDFDTKDIIFYSDQDKDSGYMLLCNLALKEWMRDNGQAVEINDAIEEGAGWGNIVWKRVKGGYIRCDLKNFYVLNQQAKTLDDSPTIERYILTQSDLRAKAGVYKNVDEVIKECGNKGFNPVPNGTLETKETPYYEIYERNGEISEAALFEAQGETGGDEDKYVLAKIVVAGIQKGKTEGRYILYAEPLPGMMSDWFKEYHRGRYSGRWWRLGIIEILLDIQTRANEISNQIALGLEWASKSIFRSKDVTLVNNILTDMKNGDVVKSEDIQQVTVRMEGLDQLIADWNRLMNLADHLTNSYDIVAGGGMPSGSGMHTYRALALLNSNAMKLYDLFRQRMAIPVQEVFHDWIMPQLLKNLKAKDVLRLTGDSDMMQQYYEMIVNAWYIKNLLALGPHSPEVGQALKEKKLQEIMSKKDQLVALEKGWLDGVKPRIQVVISGENVNLQKELDTYSTFITLEADPVRRTALIEMAMKRSGLNVASLPKTPPQQQQPVEQKGQQSNGTQDRQDQQGSK